MMCLWQPAYDILPDGAEPLMQSLFDVSSVPVSITTIDTPASSAGTPDRSTHILRLGESIVLEQQPSALPAPPPPAASASASSHQRKAENDVCVTDAMFFTGGVVWSCEFAPWAEGTSLADVKPTGGTAAHAPGDMAAEPRGKKRKQGSSAAGASASTLAATASHGASQHCTPAEVLAVCVHPKQHPRNKAGTVQNATGAVQLWGVLPASSQVAPQRSVPSTSNGANGVLPAGQEAENTGAPRLLACLVHDGAVTWDAKWCPSPNTFLQSHRHALAGGTGSVPSASGGTQGPVPPEPPAATCCGILALVLGDGTVCVSSVPDVIALGGSVSSARLTSSTSHSPHSTPAAPGTGAASRPPQHTTTAPAVSNALRAPVSNSNAGRPADAADETSVPERDETSRVDVSPGVPGGGTQAVALRLAPVVTLTLELLGGSVPSTCEWHPGTGGTGGTQLLVGGWDGCVSLWRLPDTRMDRLQGVFHVRCDPLPIRRLLWQPQDDLARRCDGWDAAATVASVDGLEACRFASVSHSGRLAVWDTRDMLLPLFERSLQRCPSLDMAWTVCPASIVVVLEDGSVRQTMMEPIFYDRDTASMMLQADMQVGCLWSCHHSRAVGATAMCGDDGVVVLMFHEHEVETRNRKSFAPVAGLRSDGRGGVAVLCAEDLPVLTTPFYPGGRVNRNKTARGGAPGGGLAFQEDAQTLFTTRFSPNGDHAAWLASGGAAGLVRLQRISAVEAKTR